MAKKIIMEDYDLDINQNSDEVGQKLPQGMAARAIAKEIGSEFYDIPCENLIVYQGKSEGDFSQWNPENFAKLVESIQEHGVMEPITVRTIEGKSNRYEILAGEHRWKASQKLGLKTIPARIKRNCSDEDAIAIFSLTNVMRRDTSLRDKAFGCWLYTTKTKSKMAKQVQEFEQDGILSGDDLKLSRTQMYRYSCIHQLPEELFARIEAGAISIEQGARLFTLEEDQRVTLSRHANLIKDGNSVKLIMDLAKGEIPDQFWEEETLVQLLSQKKKPSEQKESLSFATTQARSVIKKYLPKEMYGDTERILEEALDMYFEKYPRGE